MNKLVFSKLFKLASDNDLLKKKNLSTDDINKLINEKSWSMGTGTAAFMKSPISLTLVGGTIGAKSKAIEEALKIKGIKNKLKMSSKLIPSVMLVAAGQAIINSAEGLAQKKFQHLYEPIIRKHYAKKYPKLAKKILASKGE
jgi:hypothetical protein